MSYSDSYLPQTTALRRDPGSTDVSDPPVLDRFRHFASCPTSVRWAPPTPRYTLADQSLLLRAHFAGSPRARHLRQRRRTRPAAMTPLLASLSTSSLTTLPRLTGYPGVGPSVAPGSQASSSQPTQSTSWPAATRFFLDDLLQSPVMNHWTNLLDSPMVGVGSGPLSANLLPLSVCGFRQLSWIQHSTRRHNCLTTVVACHRHP